jgi:hypothetical protein
MRGLLPTVWKEKRSQRMRRLENEVAAGKAERAELRRRLELFEKIAAAAGATLDDPAQNDAGATETSAPVPPSLLAAAQDPRRSTPVRLEVDGSELIAVVDGEGGDPHEWWSAIRRLASRLGNAS